MGHISDIDIEYYLDDDLGLVKRSLLKRHVEGCESCRRRLEAARRDREYLRAMGAGMAKLEQADEDIEKSSIGRAFDGK